jgi:MFS family permease
VRSKSTLLILGTAQFLMVLDGTVMNVSISQIVKDLHTTIPDVQLAITAYTLVMAAFMLTGAKLGDRWGRRRAFSIGLAIYGAGSLTTALSPNVTVLLIGWSGVEGIGAVLVIPAIVALTAVNYEGRERALAFGLIGGVAGAGAAVGPLIGGFVTTALSWRVVFASETVLVALILTLVRRIGDRAPQAREKFDLAGAALSALGLGLAVFGILRISEWGLFTPIGAPTIAGTRITPFGFSIVPFLILAGLVVLGAFARWEQRLSAAGRTPLLAPDLLRIPQLRAGASTLVVQYLILAGLFFVLPLYLQVVLGKDALQTGARILPISITLMVTAVSGPRLAARSSPRRVVQIGLAFLFVGVIGVMATISETLASAPFAVSLAVFGAGVGLVISQLGNVVMSSVAQSRSSEAGGLQGASQNLGQSLGTALIGAVLLTGLTSGFHDRVRADPSIPPALSRQIVAGTEAGLPMISSAQFEALAGRAGLSSTQVNSLNKLYGDAQISALKRALLVAAACALLVLWLARALPARPLGEQDPGPSERALADAYRSAPA